MSRWFRWYEGTAEDGKFRVVARVSRVTVRDAIALWAFILEDAAHLEHRGVCHRNEDFMASILDFDDGVVERILEAMERVGMISVGHGAITVCNFGKRQFDGDADPTAAERQRRKRERERDRAVSNADVTRDSRPPETETETETETEEEKKGEPPSMPGEITEAMEAWNQLASDLSLPTITKFSANRRSKLAARLRDCGGIDGWRSALAKIRGSPFCRGDNDRGWKADFDFLLQESSFIKLMEGRYDDRGKTSKQKSSRSKNFAILDAIVAEAYRREAAESGTDGQGDPVAEAGLRQRTG